MNKSQQSLLGVILFGLLILPGLVWGIVNLYEMVEQPEPRSDFCSKEVTARVHAVLLDMSDPPSQRQIADLNTWMDQLISSWRYDERLVVYVLNADLRSIPMPVFSSCRPQLTANEAPTSATDEWLQGQAQPFIAKVRNEFAVWITNASPGPESPILEYLIAMTQSDVLNDSQDKQIDLISDLGQNSYYFEDNSMTDSFKNMEIHIWRLIRGRRQGGKKVMDYLASHGASVILEANLR